MRPKPPQARPKSGITDFAASDAAEAVPRPVAALVDSFKPGAVIPAHAHKRAQLIFAVKGTMTVRAAGGLWILPPSHALWVPGGVARGIRNDCHVLFVSPLLRELIVRAMELPALYEESGMEGRVMQLILEEIASLPAQPLGLRMPRDPRLLRLCEAVLRDVSLTDSIGQLGASVGLSERSVIRLFPKETGLSFGRWHKQARLLKAFELFEQGESVTRVAFELGYSGPSAFAKMFRRMLGKVPLAARFVGPS
jgi:AraC-like DNA-binding protein/quercetin dioxygenase-like cupin family protein